MNLYIWSLNDDFTFTNVTFSFFFFLGKFKSSSLNSYNNQEQEKCKKNDEHNNSRLKLGKR